MSSEPGYRVGNYNFCDTDMIVDKHGRIYLSRSLTFHIQYMHTDGDRVSVVDIPISTVFLKMCLDVDGESVIVASTERIIRISPQGVETTISYCPRVTKPDSMCVTKSHIIIVNKARSHRTLVGMEDGKVTVTQNTPYVRKICYRKGIIYTVSTTQVLATDETSGICTVVAEFGRPIYDIAWFTVMRGYAYFVHDYNTKLTRMGPLTLWTRETHSETPNLLRAVIKVLMLLRGKRGGLRNLPLDMLFIIFRLVHEAY